MNTRTFLVAAMMGGFALAGGVHAQEQRPPQPDLSAAAAKMGVPKKALEGCMPGPKGEKTASAEQRPARPDAAKVTACLGKAGYSVKKADVEAGLKAAAPAPRS
ncbi:hypothetical protein [Falsirhodobacter algicola]|uniref:Uncharacterized protein n=1 Tax=Falsirhodobacter algicola TaxID=2692330 RepID=A0A8J8MUY3_9RHOB|nr:hypothetical protein [Falsirhodobacter algicola]QUS37014.1 hypothetical protein GR316_11510 [Falsirhodobacter algicola]